MRLLPLLLVASAAPAFAQSPPPLIDVQRFDPVPQGKGFARVREAEQMQAWSWHVGLGINYGLRPLELGVSSTRGPQAPVIEHLLGFDLVGAVALGDRVQVGLGLPFLQLQPGVDSNPYAAALGHSGNVAGIGDLQLAVGVQVLRQGDFPISLSVAPRFVFPTGTRGMFVGSGVLGAGLDVAVGHRWRRLRLSGTVGFAIHTAARPTLDLMPDDELRWAIAAGIPLGPKDIVEPFVELTAATVISPRLADQLSFAAFHPTHTPVEVDAGVRIDPPGPFHVSIGVGRGIGPGFGTPDLRVFALAGLQFVGNPDPDGDGIKGADDQCRTEPEDVDGFQDEDGCPDPDNDGDGVLDVDDGAPNDPEDADGFEDEDGVPDPDNDGDGLADGDDQCPLEAEDADGWQDGNGCPDPDNDGDGVLDVDDAAPNEPEDVDGWEDEDGAPDPDNDGDRFLDADDGCPNEPEVVNGVDDDDGCPDEGKIELDTDKGEIFILEKVYFATGSSRILRRSYPLLDAVAGVLVDNPQVTLVEVQGHTDIRGSESSNLRLSQARAESVAKYLTNKGVDPTRLAASGYGESQPIDPGNTAEAHEKNRRVQFIVKEVQQ